MSYLLPFNCLFQSHNLDSLPQVRERTVIVNFFEIIKEDKTLFSLSLVGNLFID
jgi:hypothetical protein